jgi:hypothetical protein
MKTALGLVSCLFVTVALTCFAAEDTVDALKQRQAALAQERKDCEARLLQRRQAIEKSRDMASTHAAVEKAMEALTAALTSDPDIKRAREAQTQARKALESAVSSAAGTSDDSKALDNQRAELEAKRAMLQFEICLADLQLTHAASPAQAEAEADPAVAEARKAAAAAEAESRSQPIPEAVADAEKQFADARAKTSELWRKRVAASGDLASAQDAHGKAQEALRKAEEGDSRNADLASARKELERVRAAAFARHADASPLVRDLSALESDWSEIESDRAATDTITGMARERVREGSDKTVVKARQAVEAAQKAVDALLPADIREMGVKRSAAWQAAEDKANEYVKTKAPDLMARLDAANGKVDDLKKQFMAGKSVGKELLAAIKERATVAAIERSQHWESRASAPGYGEARAAWQGIKAEHEAKRAAVAGYAAAEQARKDAGRALAAAVDAQLADDDVGKVALGMQAGVAARRRAAEYRMAVLKFRLYEAASPIAQAVERQADVAEAAAKVRAIETELREKPAASVGKAREAMEAARARVEVIEVKLREDRDFARATEAQSVAEKAVRAARTTADAAQAPSRARAQDAWRAVEKVVSEKLRAVPSGAPLAAAIVKAQQELLSVDQTVRGIASKKEELRRAAERGGNPKVALARKEAADADAALKKAEESDRIRALRKAVDEARAARESALAAAVEKDKDSRQIREELTVLAQVDKEVAARIKAATK